MKKIIVLIAMALMGLVLFAGKSEPNRISNAKQALASINNDVLLMVGIEVVCYYYYQSADLMNPETIVNTKGTYEVPNGIDTLKRPAIYGTFYIQRGIG